MCSPVACYNTFASKYSSGNPPLPQIPHSLPRAHALPAIRSELGAWFGTTGKWETSILPTFTAAVAYMKEHKGAQDLGCAGFCWGGMIAMKAAALGAEAEAGVKAAANAHPAMLSPELAEDVSFAGGCADQRNEERRS